MRLLYLFCLFVFSLLTLSACQRLVEEPPTFEQDYAPLALGMRWTYSVDSVVYNEYLRSVDSNHFQLQERLTGQEEDAAGLSYFILERWQRSDSSQPWSFVNRWKVQYQGQNLERTEDNQRYLKLVSPLQIGLTWDGLAYLKKDTLLEIPGGSIDVYKDWGHFTYQTLHSPWQQYDSTLVVLQVDKINQIERRFAQERYAKGIGLVHRKIMILDTQCGGNLLNCIGLPWELKAEKGFIVEQQLLEFSR
jgi:hypothetical protein